ncbi:MAG: Translation initiation factor IF-2 [Bacteroidetes bacterium ADurb.Bin234]|jgi:translation initiation factor IF-2|nr:MAG: Translation initiation factor IF-2 [Bacteroidetes bacterium ADurb.Bin234]
MSEEKKIIPRLGKAAKEFNVATSTIVEFLLKKGIVVENNDNTKLTAEWYSLIDQEYKSEKDVKEESKKLEIGSGFKTISTSDNLKDDNRLTQEPEKKEIIINQPTQIEKPHVEEPKIKESADDVDLKISLPKQSVKIIGKIDLDAQPKPKKKKEEKDKKPKPVKSTTPTVKKEEKAEVKTDIPEIEPEPAKEEVETQTLINEKEIVIDENLISKETDETNHEMEILTDDTEAITISEETIEEEVDLEDNKEPEKIIIKTPVLKNNLNIIGKINLDEINSRTKPKKKSKEELLKEKNDKREKELEARKLQKEQLKKRKLEQQSEHRNKTTQDDNTSEGNASSDVIQTRTGKKEWKKNIPSISDDKENIKEKEKKKRKRIRTSFSKESDIPSKSDDYSEGFKKRKDKFTPIKGVHKIDFTEEEIEKQVRKTMARMAPLGKTKSSKYRKEKREHIQHEIIEAKERSEMEKNILKVTEFITANELANMMNIPVTQIISTCMSIGMAVAINQRLGAETISLLADEFGFQVQYVGLDEEEEELEEVSPEDLVERSPIVTVMGHVDHGKTSLLDYIRKTNVIAGESGGITQHIGAYEVTLANNKRITFLDTPGHEAFTAMRARGAKVTDLVIVVIAADDSVMPQTIEAINHAQAAGVPIIFAINKIDKPGADPEKIRAALANMNLLVEEWGGKIQSQDISAKKGLNVDVLLEKVLIEAEMLDLKANSKTYANGTVIESSLDKGRGYVAKILVQNGTLHTGDILVAGVAYGKVRAMYNERNQIIKEAGPSVPVLILGLNSAPQAGDTFKVYKEEREAKQIVNKRVQLVREQGLRTQKHITLDEIGRRIAIGDFKELNVIVKGDVDGSVEALSDSLLRLTTSEVQVNIIHKSVGQVIESDVLLASASNAIIIAFQVRPSAGARKIAEQEQVDIRTYSIIYDAINELKDAIEGMRAPEMKENIVCNIEVRETFHITKVGTIAGCYVLDGKVQRNTQIRVIRDGIVIYTGKLGSLKRFKDDVKEVVGGYECGLNIDGFNDIKIGDIIEGFEQVQVKR